jgi:signal transduction histidine kinase
MDWNSGPASIPYKTSAKWNHHKYRVLQSPVEIDNQIRYVIQVAAPMHDLDETLSHLRILFWLTIPAGLLFAGIIALLITRLAFKPMMNMVVTAEQITASNLDARLELPRGHDEVYTLGSALNEMIKRIDTTLKGQRQFIADASHELRTPLTIIRSELESVMRSSRHSSTKQSVVISLTELDHLASMINNLLTLARLDGSQVTLKVSPVRMDELIIECVQAVRGIATGKGVRLKVFVEEALEVQGDEEKLKSVIFNLLENAVKYSPKKGVVTVSLALSRAEAAAVLTVGDRGMGIPVSEQDRIFERFFRGAQPRSSSEGSGLGLAIVKRFVEMHKGRISVQSEEKKGSVFTVEIPLGDPRA